MKKQINEIKRIQTLAGIIKEDYFDRVDMYGGDGDYGDDYRHEDEIEFEEKYENFLLGLKNQIKSEIKEFIETHGLGAEGLSYIDVINDLERE